MIRHSLSTRAREHARSCFSNIGHMLLQNPSVLYSHLPIRVSQRLYLVPYLPQTHLTSLDLQVISSEPVKKFSLALYNESWQHFELCNT